MVASMVQQKPIKSAVIVSKVYKRPVSGAIRDIASKLTKLGVKVYLILRNLIPGLFYRQDKINYFINLRHIQRY